MKHIDSFTQRILAIGVSVTMVVLAATLFFQTAPFAKADSFPSSLDAATIDGFQAEGIQATGKYKMEYQLIFDPSENDYAHFILVYDSENASSKMYYRKGAAFIPSSGQLPEKPL